MPDININELSPTGSELLLDSESFLGELTDDEIDNIKGGLLQIEINLNTLQLLDYLNAISSQGSVTLNSVYSNTVNSNTVGSYSINGYSQSNLNTVVVNSVKLL